MMLDPVYLLLSICWFCFHFEKSTVIFYVFCNASSPFSVFYVIHYSSTCRNLWTLKKIMRNDCSKNISVYHLYRERKHVGSIAS